MYSKLKRPLLLGLGAVASFALAAGTAVSLSGQAVKADAAGISTVVASFSSDDVVSESSYKTYANSDWVVTFGGNNSSVGTNQKNWGSMKLSGQYAKLAGDEEELKTSSAAVYSLNKLEDVSSVAVAWTSSKISNSSNNYLHLMYSVDNSTFECVSEIKITSEKEYEFSIPTGPLDGYFAVVLKNGVSSAGDFRFDDVTVNFLKTPSEGEIVKVTSIVVNADSDTVEAGRELQFTAVVTPEDATQKEVEWSVDNEQLATIDQTGLLTAIAEGTVVVKATAKDGSEVFGIKSIDINPSKAMKFSFGEHADFSSWGGYAEHKLSYEEFSIAWGSVMKPSQTISGMPVSKGTTATLTASKPMLSVEFAFEQWAEKTQSIALSIDGVEKETLDFPKGGNTISYTSETPFTNVTVETKTTNNQIGWECVWIEFAETPSIEKLEIEGEASINSFLGTTKLSVKVTPDGASKSVTWSSSNPEVATVDDSGLVKGLSEGEAVITAVSNDDPEIKAELTITVDFPEAAIDAKDVFLRAEDKGFPEDNSSNERIIYGSNGMPMAFSNVSYDFYEDTTHEIVFKGSSSYLANVLSAAPISKVTIIPVATSTKYQNVDVYFGATYLDALNSKDDIAVKTETTPGGTVCWTFDAPEGAGFFRIAGNSGSYSQYVSAILIEFAGDDATSAREWATNFLNVTGDICETSQFNHGFPKETWEELASSYDSLSPEAKAIISAEYPTIGGELITDIQKAVERYIYIAVAYADDGFDPFMNDVDIYGFVNANGHSDDSNDLPMTIGLAAGIALLAIAAGSAVIIKKRKSRI